MRPVEELAKLHPTVSALGSHHFFPGECPKVALQLSWSSHQELIHRRKKPLHFLPST